jgi:adenylosuccinate lyase
MSGLGPIELPDVANGDRFDAIDPLDSRYYDTAIARYLSERARVAYQAHVEAALAHTLADFGVCSQTVAKQIEAAAATVSVEAVYEEEQTTKHDIKALVNCIKAPLVDEAKPYVHFGATSYDIISTATALQFKTAILQLVVPRLQALLLTLIEMTETYASTNQIGRTHGQHAVPITFGFAMSGYVSRLGESIDALTNLANQLNGKFSGAVGSYNALSVFVDDPLKFEITVLDYLGLQPAAHSTQIVPAEGMVRVLDELSITAGIMANLSHDMRHLQRSEIAEVRERFEKGQTGSSTMAHKRNPWNFENVISMSKQVTAQIVNAQLNISSEHQRDLTDSASSRFYGITLASVASMAQRLNRVMSRLEVDEASMTRNLHMSSGAIAAEPLYLLLEKYGHTTGHEAAKRVAHRSLDDKRPLHETIQNDVELNQYWQRFTDKERKLITHPETAYTGLASKKAQGIAKHWKIKLKTT